MVRGAGKTGSAEARSSGGLAAGLVGNGQEGTERTEWHTRTQSERQAEEGKGRCEDRERQGEGKTKAGRLRGGEHPGRDGGGEAQGQRQRDAAAAQTASHAER